MYEARQMAEGSYDWLAFFYHPGPPAEGGTAHSEPALPHQSLTKRAPHRLAHKQSDRGSLSSSLLPED